MAPDQSDVKEGERASLWLPDQSDVKEGRDCPTLRVGAPLRVDARPARFMEGGGTPPSMGHPLIFCTHERPPLRAAACFFLDFNT